METYDMEKLIPVVNAESSRSEQFLAGLDQSAWSKASACEGWTLGDVAAHLTTGAEMWADSLTRAISGDAGPREGQSVLAPGVRGSEANQANARSSREQMGQQLLEKFTAGIGRMSQALSKLSAEDWDKPSFHGRGPMPVQRLVALRLWELAIHGWDIRSGLDKSASLNPECLPQLIDGIYRWLRISFVSHPELPAPMRYRFEVAAPVPVRQDVLVTGDSYQTETADAGDADVVFRCDTGTYILVMCGRLSVDQAVSGGRLTVGGRQDQAANFHTWFRGF